MKLYTEEQVIKAYKDGNRDGFNHVCITDTYLDFVTPIELPSDEEMEKKANNWCTVELDEDGFVRLNDYYDLHELPAFIAGATWMKEQIFNKNK